MYFQDFFWIYIYLSTKSKYHFRERFNLLSEFYWATPLELPRKSLRKFRLVCRQTLFANTKKLKWLRHNLVTKRKKEKKIRLQPSSNNRYIFSACVCIHLCESLCRKTFLFGYQQLAYCERQKKGCLTISKRHMCN